MDRLTFRTSMPLTLGDEITLELPGFTFDRSGQISVQPGGTMAQNASWVASTSRLTFTVASAPLPNQVHN